MNKTELLKLLQDQMHAVQTASSARDQALFEVRGLVQSLLEGEDPKAQLLELLCSVLRAEDVQFVVYADGDLGVKIGSKIFTLYKGGAILRGAEPSEVPRKYRPVRSREFGEVINTSEPADQHDWFDVP